MPTPRAMIVASLTEWTVREGLGFGALQQMLATWDTLDEDDQQYCLRHDWRALARLAGVWRE